MTNEIQFYIPFDGFYNSIYDSIIDESINNEISERYMTIEQSENIDYKPIFNAISEDVFDKIKELFNDEFDLFTENGFFVYDGLYSPKYYNYSTDKIMAKCSNEVFLTILNYFENNDELINYINESSKSRSGFHSFYEGYNEVKKDASIYLEYLFQWFVFEHYRDEVLQETTDNIHELIYNNLTI
tara:strand:+ start:144 stop:698 length:555 start_codon:yes stop_codon:yes gene_type:complete